MARLPSKVRKKAEWLLFRAEAALLSSELRQGEAARQKPDEALPALAAMADEHSELELGERVAHLGRARDDADERRRYIGRHGCTGVWRFEAGAGVRVYRLRVETFPHHVNNVVLIVEPGHVILFDVGSAVGESTADLELGFAVVRDVFGEDVTLSDVDTIVISHAHIDHFGGVHALKQRTGAAVCVHELDARVLSNFEERVVVATKDVDVYLRRAGVDDETRAGMLEMYGSSRHWFKPCKVDRTLRDDDVVGSGHRVIHVPGHCPGLICLRVGDVLLASDHILARITPHQFPQAITPFAGLEHYFESLGKVRELEGINVVIGGHEEPIADLRGRIDEIEAFHRERLRHVRGICEQPRTIFDVTREMFGALDGYNRILAVEEAGAHVEYLHARGQLKIDNLQEVAEASDPVLLYVAVA